MVNPLIINNSQKNVSFKTSHNVVVRKEFLFFSFRVILFHNRVIESNDFFFVFFVSFLSGIS